jgi:hypothetical protein
VSDSPSFQPDEDQALRALLQPILRASPELQRAVYDELGRYLSERGAKEDPWQRVRRAQDEALRCLKLAITKLEQTPEDRLTAAAYDAIAQRLGLMRKKAVADAFGSWRNACVALRGEHVPFSARQRQILRKTSGRVSDGSRPGSRGIWVGRSLRVDLVVDEEVRPDGGHSPE